MIDRTLDLFGDWNENGVFIIVVYLQMSLQRTLSQALVEAQLVLTEADGMIRLEELCRDNRWARSMVWLAHATRLDASPPMYFPPEIHEALQILTGRDVPYVMAAPQHGRISIRLVGSADAQPFYGFWDGECQYNLQHNRTLISDDMYQYCMLSRAIEEDLGRYGGECHWGLAFREAFNQFWMHRLFVHRIGNRLGVSVSGHDLSLSRVLIAGRGWLSHWKGPARGYSFADLHITSLAKGVVNKLHHQKVDHSIAYQGGDVGGAMLREYIGPPLSARIP